MNWRRLAWLVILLLVVAIFAAGVELKEAYKRLGSAESGDTDSVEQSLASIQKRIEGHTAHLSNLEQFTLWEPETDFMSWATQQANATGVRVIGVEHLPGERESDYRDIPVTVTIRGGYNPLGRFINQLEHCPSAVKINSMRIRRKEHTPEHVIMDLSVSYFQKVDGAGSAIPPLTSERTIRQVTSANDDNSAYVRDFVYLKDSIRDPFIPVSAPVFIARTAPSGRKLVITLTGIIWDDDDPIAIVADTKNKSHLVRTGEEINRAKILSIHPRSITIQSDGRQQELVLWHEKL